MYYVNHICATNDVNGNPRRALVVYDEQGRHVETIDEGYDGYSKLCEKYPKHKVLMRVEVPVKEYKRFLKM